MNNLRSVVVLIFVITIQSCGGDKTICSEKEELSILPGKVVGDFMLGMKEEHLGLLCNGYERKVSNGFFSKHSTTYYFLNNMSFTVRLGRLEEINNNWSRSVI